MGNAGSTTPVSLERNPRAHNTPSSGVSIDLASVKMYLTIQWFLFGCFVALVSTLGILLMLRNGRLGSGTSKWIAFIAVALYLASAFVFSFRSESKAKTETPPLLGGWSEVKDPSVALRVIHAAGASVDAKVWYRSSGEYRVQDGDSFIVLGLDLKPIQAVSADAAK